MSDINISELRSLAEKEPVASFLGIRLLELAEGYAKVGMTLRPEFKNFNGMVFGGIIMSLADQAFAYANNSVFKPNVASQFNIHFLARADVGEELTAECRVLRAGKRACVSEMTVTNGEGKLIARASGTTIPLM
ncbi:MAG: PaaI family thioesterase [Chloroflexi bacterium]|nr:PaaI family thioesterase [Chloroflexota bacterium]